QEAPEGQASRGVPEFSMGVSDRNHRIADRLERGPPGSRRCAPSFSQADLESFDPGTEMEASMNEPTARRIRNRGAVPSLGRSSQAAGQGFSRPGPVKSAPQRRERPAGERPVLFTLSMDWLFLELHALALDNDRARSYLSRPGCNTVLGEAQLSRAMA